MTILSSRPHPEGPVTLTEQERRLIAALMYSTTTGNVGWARVAACILDKVSRGDEHYLAEAHDEIQPRVDVINMGGNVISSVDPDLFVIHL